MLLKGPAAATALAKGDPTIRLYVLAGPDEAGSRAMATMLAASLGPAAERIDISASRIKDDPALLADEAAAIGMFAGRRWINVSIASGAGDEVLAACGALLDAPAAGNPVIVIGSGMTARSKLVKLAEGNKAAVAVVSYPPDVSSAAGLAREAAKPLGLELGAQVPQAIAAATGGDRGLIAREVEKLALYCDAVPERTARAEIDAWHSIGANIGGDDMSAAVNMILEGRLRDLPELFAVIDATGNGGIPLLRALARRAIELAGLRSYVDGGVSPARAVESHGQAVFFKERGAVTTQLRLWPSAALARLVERLHTLERTLKANGDSAGLLQRGALLDIARAAAATGRQ